MRDLTLFQELNGLPIREQFKALKLAADQLKIAKQELQRIAVKQNYHYDRDRLSSLQNIVCSKFRISVGNLFGRGRNPHFVAARFTFTYLAHGEKFTESEISRFLGKDRATIYYYLDKFHHSYPQWSDNTKEC